MKKWIAALLCLLLVTGPVLASERFEDVAPDAYYAEAVAWAVDRGITNGMGNRQFAPDQLCTIGQALTFLWRACGSPEASIAQPFFDVAETDYYAGAAAWAYENGLVTGTELGAGRPCTRRAMVTYLWKLAGSPISKNVETGDRDWNLLLVNPWNAIPADFSVELQSVGWGHSVDARCADALTEMLSACRTAGYSASICSSYRTHAYQQSLFDQRVAARMAQGMTRAEAEAVTARSTAVPGTSEHQIGLAVDLVDSGYWQLDSTQASRPTQQWLMAHSWEYGFILRYPSDKSELTGIIYEPWHYRYVGKDAARTIYEQEICLEEYLEELDTFSLAAAWARETGITTSSTDDSFRPNENCSRAHLVTFLWRALEQGKLRLP